MAPRGLYANEVDWTEHETRKDGLHAIVEDIEVEIYPETDDSGEPTRKWVWTVTPTATVTETPETFSQGLRPGKVSATWSATKQLNAAIKHYRKAEPTPDPAPVKHQAKDSAKTTSFAAKELARNAKANAKLPADRVVAELNALVQAGKTTKAEG